MARDGNSGGGFHFPFAALWIIIWLLSRAGSGNRSGSTAAEHRVDVQAIARGSDRRRTAGRSRQNTIPVPPRSPRSHPMWDRDLDGI